MFLSFYHQSPRIREFALHRQHQTTPGQTYSTVIRNVGDDYVVNVVVKYVAVIVFNLFRYTLKEEKMYETKLLQLLLTQFLVACNRARDSIDNCWPVRRLACLLVGPSRC